MDRRLKTRLIPLAVVAAATLASPASALGAQACESASATPAQASKRAVVKATLCVLNAERVQRGLRPLRLNQRLSKAARRHAYDMARRKYFSHFTPDGGTFVDRIERTGYLRGARRWAVGENLAWATLNRAAPRGVTRMWMHSPGHRANILSSAFREIGIGIASGAPVHGAGRSAATYATDFGARG